MIFYQWGNADAEIPLRKLRDILFDTFAKMGSPKKVLAIPPDFTRFHSFGGWITKFAHDYFGDVLTDILPALGTHSPMSKKQMTTMFPGVPHAKFRVHDWRHDVLTLGVVPDDFIEKVTQGKLRYPWPAQVNKLLVHGHFDLILSIGQVVPHEVIGMANYNKNIFVGTGGAEGINKSHFIGAVYGMERIMGRANNPVRDVLNYASEHFIKQLPIVYVLTVVGKNHEGQLVVKGLFIGDDASCFEQAAELSLKVNFEMLDRPVKKMVVYLDPAEYKSTWLGNKSVYRTRMALADNGELIVLAPGIKEFGEDKQIDRLIRKYGYRSTPFILEQVRKNQDLQNNLAAAAHLIHGSSEGRFRITYCTDLLTQEEIVRVGYHYAPLNKMMKRYNPFTLQEGFNILPDGEEIFYISNPALGLWAHKDRFGKKIE